jgi:hypothetical protein
LLFYKKIERKENKMSEQNSEQNMWNEYQKAYRKKNPAKVKEWQQNFYIKQALKTVAEEVKKDG